MAGIDGIVMYLMMDTNLELGKVVSIFQERFINGWRAKIEHPDGSEEK